MLYSVNILVKLCFS